MRMLNQNKENLVREEVIEGESQKMEEDFGEEDLVFSLISFLIVIKLAINSLNALKSLVQKNKEEK